MVGHKLAEEITPYKVSVILLYMKYAALRPRHWDTKSEDILASFKDLPQIMASERKETGYIIVQLIQAGDMALSHFLKMLEAPGLVKRHITDFILGLKDMYIHGIDSLLSLFESVDKVVVMVSNQKENFPCVTTSLMGIYLRQMLLCFKHLSFSQVVSLYEEFRCYCTDCPAFTLMLESSKDGEMSAGTLFSVDTKLNSFGVSSDSVNIFCDFNATDVDVIPTSSHKTDPEVESIKSISFSDDLFSKDTRATRKQAELFIAHQTNHIYANEPAALSPVDLQQRIQRILKQNHDMSEAHFLSYLNCMRVREFAGALHSITRCYDGQVMKESSVRYEELCQTFRKAALNIAALHAQFGHKEIALSALEEAISLSQENNDDKSLQYALAWLYSLSSEHKLSLLRHSILKSSELALPYLGWLALLNHLVELSSTYVTPQELFQNIHSSIASFSGTNCHLYSSLWAVQAGLWAQWGNASMVALCSQLLLHMNSNGVNKVSADPACAVLCNLAMAFMKIGELSHAGEVLQSCQEWFPKSCSASRHWVFTQSLLSLESFLLQGYWTQSKAIISTLTTTHIMHARYRYALLLLAKGEIIPALSFIWQLRSCPEVSITPDMKVQLQILQGEALAIGGSTWGALPLFVQAVSESKKYHLIYLTALSRLHLANAQLQLDLVSEANRNASSALPVILAEDSVLDKARATFLLAKIKVRLASGFERSPKILQSAKYLDDTALWFKKVKAYHRVKDVLYMQARLFHEIGEVEERNRAAMEFRNLEEQHPSSAFYPYTVWL